MDTDRISGAATQFGGQVKDAAGDLMGDAKLQAEGKMDKLAGRAQRGYGRAQDAARADFVTLGQQVDQLMREKPLQALLSAAAFGFVMSYLLRRR